MAQPYSNRIHVEISNRIYRLHYLDWGKPGNPVLFCAHGLTRNGHDFDFLARELSSEFRVIAPDYPGRGSSDWLIDKLDYSIPTYVNASLALMDELELDAVNWLGTSMGGLVGMGLAALHPQRLEHLIINDVGPEIPKAAVARITDYLSLSHDFEDPAEFEQHVRMIYAPFGPLSDEQWRHLARYSRRIDSAGRIVSNYDPDIVIPFRQNTTADSNLWDFWKNLTHRIFLLHGENSDILLPCIIEKMKQYQPDLVCRSISETGHAPALMDDAQIELVKRWLKCRKD